MAAGALGLLARLALASHSRGTNDIMTWKRFAMAASEHGVLWMYANVEGWNHPPLMGVLAAAQLRLSHAWGHSFAFTFKLVPIGADGLSAYLLWRTWKSRRGAAVGAGVVALFAASADALLVSAYHGNYDPVVGALVLLACWLAEERRSPTWVGLALGAAVNVKLVPVILVPAFVSDLRRRSDFARFVLGLGAGALPFVPVLVSTGAAFHRQAIAYNSNFDNWGIAYFIGIGEEWPWLQPAASWLHGFYVVAGRYVIVSVVLAVSAYSRWVRPLSVYERAALGLSAFLVFTPGFGVQYTAMLGPVLFAADWRWGGVYGAAAGAFLACTYYAFWTGGQVLHSFFTSTFPPSAAELGLLAWTCVLLFFVATLRGSKAGPAVPVDSRPRRAGG